MADPAAVVDPNASPLGEQKPAEADASKEPKEGDKPAEGEPKAEEAAAPKPEDYKLTVPEGMVINDEAVGSFRQIAAEAKLPPEQAQALFKLHTDQLQAFAAEQTKVWDEMRGNWTKELNALPDFSPANREASLQTIGKAIDQFGTPEVRQAFDLTGAGWNPHIVSFVLKLAKQVTESGPPTQGRPATQPRDAAEVMYPGQ